MTLQFQLADLFESVADAVPDREAVVYGERRLTFRQFDERATQMAHYLRGRGIGAGDRVGLYLYNCNEYLEGALAAFKLGASPVNINFRYVEEELRYLCDDADLKAMIFHREFAPRVAAVAPRLPAMRTLIFVEDGSGASVDALASAGAGPPHGAGGAGPPHGAGGTGPPHGAAPTEYEAALAGQSIVRDFGERSPDDVYLLYTGGTTGMPKGVMWRHEDVFFAGLQGGNPGGPDITSPEQLGANAAANAHPTVTLPVAPLMHGNGHWSSLIGLHGGGKVVLAQSRRLDAHEIWSLVERERVSVMSIVGDAMARPMAEALEEKAYDVSSVFAFSSAGALFSEDVKDRLRAKLPGTLIIDAFGMSEAGHQGMNLGKNADGKLRFSIDGLTAVLDEDLRRVEAGSGKVGMLARTGRLPLGYWKDPAKTAQTFVTDPDGRRWVMAGDMATIDADGTAVVLGRGSLCINSGGEKIYPEEVELALRAHPGVYDAVVVGVPDERWGQRVAAVVQAQPGATLTLEELAEHCATRIARYKLPRELHLVEALQRSPAGKADYAWARGVALGDAR